MKRELTPGIVGQICRQLGYVSNSQRSNIEWAIIEYLEGMSVEDVVKLITEHEEHEDDF